MYFKLTLKFIIPLYLALVIFVFILNNVVAEQIRNQAIDSAKKNVAELVKIQAKQHIDDASLFSLINPDRTQATFDEVLSEINIPDIVRIKVWDGEGTIIYSNDKSIVGKSFFSTNKEFREAIAGEVVVTIKPPSKVENESEAQFTQLMEVYVPVTLKDSPEIVGVIEVYFVMDDLNQSVKESNEKIAIISTLAGLIFAIFVWVLLYFFIGVRMSKIQSLLSSVKKDIK